MIINDARKMPTTKFSELFIGDVFCENGKFYMKIATIRKSDNILINSVEIEHGTLCHFQNDLMVGNVNAEIVITNA